MQLIRSTTILVVWWMSASAPAAAIDLSSVPNAVEMMRLPPYCAAKFRSPQDPNEVKIWRDRIGSNFGDLHHYCEGLNFVNRYWGSRKSSDRGYYLQQAKNNFDYMVKAEKPDFTLRSELYSNRGEVFKLMGKLGEAINDLNKAMSINPNIVKPYLQLADLYEGGKDKVRALEVITKGLNNIPNSKALQRRYTELGGKLPYPEAVAKTMPAEMTKDEGKPEVKSEAASHSEDATSQAAADTKPTEPTVPAPQIESPKIGSPKNPYCRFCADLDDHDKRAPSPATTPAR